MYWGFLVCIVFYGVGTALRLGNRFNYLGYFMLRDSEEKDFFFLMEREGVGGIRVCFFIIVRVVDKMV